jgi:uncharacterized protein
MTSYLPDVNVWLALAYDGHVYHPRARKWLDNTDDRLFFCRVTQLGFLRLISSPRVMAKAALSPKAAWAIYDRWFEDGRIDFIPDPLDTERMLRKLTQSSQPSSRAWTDMYTAAVAQAAGLRVVTFDRGFGNIPGALLLGRD